MGKTPLRRSVLYVSGTSPVNMIQAQFYDQDCLVYDLEDSVPISEKDSARILVYQMIKNYRPKNKEVVIRVNAIDSPYFQEDLEAAVRAQPDGIRIPKVEWAKEIHLVEEKITEIEKKAGLEVGKIQIWCNIESYMGVVNVLEIAQSSKRVTALSLGAEDYVTSLKGLRTKGGEEIFYGRQAVIHAARVAEVSAIDAVFSNINDLDGLKADLETTRSFGFDGKTVVHPRQIDPVNKCFTPSEKEIFYAKEVLQAVNEGEKQSKGVITLHGEMIDLPMVKRAKTILALAKAAGIQIGDDEEWQ